MVIHNLCWNVTLQIIFSPLIFWIAIFLLRLESQMMIDTSRVVDENDNNWSSDGLIALIFSVFSKCTVSSRQFKFSNNLVYEIGATLKRLQIGITFKFMHVVFHTIWTSLAFEKYKVFYSSASSLGFQYTVILRLQFAIWANSPRHWYTFKHLLDKTESINDK